ncbi:ABC transporter permease [Bradyrhizobium sp. LTSP885]|uniref:ABC transporter substrate-binding protein n=1 Tax=Bradyrhizobium sp. LTSP885 TaxID=1619232 RepID=UPI0005CA3DFF|nr:ABC transporter substrate-binding protein [Bradyrhizobium sp. LTSP885]KJC48746.1 ABC transporter permease [Bradyrhizobium sp. LTSP885]
MPLRSTILAVSLLVCSISAAVAQSEPSSIVIGVLNDMSGNFADQSGPGSLVAAQMAIDEVGGTVLGKPIKVLGGDHQNKPDIASSLARRWYDREGVQVIVDMPNSGTALAVQEIARNLKRINITTTAGSLALTNKSCSPTSFHWMWDTYSNSYGLVKALARKKLDTWFFITADYAFGLALESDFRKAIDQTGGKTLGAVKHPVGMQDFSSQILFAQASNARAVVVASGGNDIVNTLKTANEFGLQKSGVTFVAPATFLTDVKSMGLDIGQGLTYITGFTWNYDDESRAFARKFFERHKAMPTMGQAGVYSAVRHYLRAVAEAKTVDADLVAAKMREMPVSDAVIRHGKIRDDGRLVHDMYLVEVPRKGDTQDPWDLERVLDTLPGDEIFRPLSESECSLVKK